MLGRSALLAATNSADYGNWLGNYSDVSLLLRNGTPSSTSVPFDESPTPKTITAVGNAGISTTVFKYGSSSLAFDGASRFQLAASSAWDFSGGPHTFECWVFLNAYPDGNCRFLQSGANGVSTSFVIFSLDSSGFVGSGVPSVAGTGISSSIQLPLSQWVHVALVLNGATTRLFVNGVGTTASVTMPGSTSGNLLHIGQDPTVSDNPAFFKFLNGYIDDLRITRNSARYTSDFTPPAAQLPANITDDPSYNSVSLLLRNGTLSSTSVPFDESPTPKTITAVSNAGISTTVFKYGTSSLAFDGNQHYLSIASNADFAFAGEFTVEAWVYLISAPSGDLDAFWLTDFRNANASNQGFVFGVRTVNGSLVIYGGSHATEANGSANIALATWNHLAYVRSGSTVKMYLNGVSQGSFTSSFSQAATPLIIGARFNTLTEYWHGYIDDLRITKGIARYTSNFTPPTAELPNF